MPSRTHAPRRAASAIVALAAHPALALAQSSASFSMNAVVDTGGGTSSSTSHVVTSCIGSEIAGSQSSSSFRIDSGCGATVLAVVQPGGGGGSGGKTVPVPTLGDGGIAILVALMIGVAARKLVRRGV